VAVQGDDGVSHLLLRDWAHKGVWHGVVLHSLTLPFTLYTTSAPKLQYLRLLITAFVDQAKVETYDIVTDEGSFHIIDWVNMPISSSSSPPYLMA
jgi:hypothetical protein